jgi:glycosyltransferase involved in cell wall biosynthesis
MKASLVIPCYNEAASLPALLERCARVARPGEIEVVLVDNGSIDGSPDLLRDLLPAFPGCRSVRVEKNQGYGFGVLAGLGAAEGRLLGWSHADLQADPADFLAGLALFDRYGDDIFVKGRRYGRPIADVMFTVGMSIFETALLQRRMWDINAQPTMFSRRFFATWSNPPADFSLDLYAYFEASRNGLPIHRFPVLFGKRAHGVSHWNVDWRAKAKFIRRTVGFSLQLRRSVRAR